MKVLSLFDGMACGYEALVRAGIPVEAYYASEIDKRAIQVALKNHPDIVEIGDVCQVRGEDYQGFDLVIGGSPCQNLSAAGDGTGLEGSKSRLFYEFVRIVKEVKPKFFLLENVKMKKEWMNKMTDELRGITPTLIDSSKLSAQHRERNYRVGKLQDDGTYAKVEISQPEDKGIFLKDILEKNVDESLYFTQEKIDQIANWKCYEKPLERAKTGEEKSDTLTTHCGKDSGGMKLVKIPCATQLGNSKNFGNAYGSDKAYTLRACQSNGVIEGTQPMRIRKLTPIECERLQTLEDNYTEGVSNAQRYKMLGNGWTCEVISHIFKSLK